MTFEDKSIRLGHPSYVWRFGQDRRLDLMRRYVRVESARILDIGCGIGAYVEKFAALEAHAFGVVGERTQTKFNKISDKVIEESYQIKVRNHKTDPVEVRVVEHLFRWSNWQITQSNQDYTKLDAQTIEYRVKVAPDGESTVNYTVKYSW